jgi:hypothetical protein
VTGEAGEAGEEIETRRERFDLIGELINVLRPALETLKRIHPAEVVALPPRRAKLTVFEG